MFRHRDFQKNTKSSILRTQISVYKTHPCLSNFPAEKKCVLYMDIYCIKIAFFPSLFCLICCIDYGARKEQEETLDELVTSKYSPYSVDYTWSKEARQLREIAVKSPWLITRDFILKHFQTMKIVDKNVSIAEDCTACS